MARSVPRAIRIDRLSRTSASADSHSAKIINSAHIVEWVSYGKSSGLVGVLANCGKGSEVSDEPTSSIDSWLTAVF